MTVKEKRDALRSFCMTKDNCNGCVLQNSFLKNSRCYNEPLSDEKVNENYDLVFKSNGLNADVHLVDELHNDPVNRPAHYTDGKIEVIDFIEDKNLGFCLGNAVKYISRAGKKDPTKEIEDLNKAKWYIERRIKELQEA
jgi:hypothetical protein